MNSHHRVPESFVYSTAKIGANISRILPRGGESVPLLANYRPLGRVASPHGSDAVLRSEVSNTISEIDNDQTIDESTIAAREDEMIGDLTYADLSNLINNAIRANTDLQTREAALRTQTAREIHQLKSDLKGRTDPPGIKASTLLPPKFTGDSEYSARAFLRKFDRYATYDQWDDDARIRSVPLFLEKTADIWYDELRPVPSTYEQFRRAFLHTFETDVSTFVDEQTFTRLAQKPSESVLQYYTRMIEAGEKHNISPEKRLNHFLGSLKPRIKTHVLTHGPMTLAQALEKARLAEQALISA